MTTTQEAQAFDSRPPTARGNAERMPAAGRLPRLTGVQRERLLRVALRVVQAGPLLVLAVLVIVMASLSPVFLTLENWQNLGVQTAVIGITALGQLLVIVTRGIDLSIGSVIALVGIVGATLSADGTVTNGALNILVMLAVGAAAGLFNGVAVTRGKIPALIVTLATLYGFRGLALVVSDGTPVVSEPHAVVVLGGNYLGPIPIPVIILAGCAGLTALVARRTKFGRWVFAIGGNPEAARRLGIPVAAVLTAVFVLSGLASGLGGVLTAGRAAAGFPNAGNLAELASIAAVIIGGASLRGGRGTVNGTIVGALILGVIANGLNLLNVNPFYQQIATGVIILLAVELDILRRTLESRFRSLQAELAAAS